MSLPIITVPFEPALHEAFIERLEKSKNYNALNFIAGTYEGLGYKCPLCNETKPFYCYLQFKKNKSGLHLSKCSQCYRERNRKNKVKSFF